LLIRLSLASAEWAALKGVTEKGVQ